MLIEMSFSTILDFHSNFVGFMHRTPEASIECHLQEQGLLQRFGSWVHFDENLSRGSLWHQLMLARNDFLEKASPKCCFLGFPSQSKHFRKPRSFAPTNGSCQQDRHIHRCSLTPPASAKSQRKAAVARISKMHSSSVVTLGSEVFSSSIVLTGWISLDKFSSPSIRGLPKLQLETLRLPRNSWIWMWTELRS